MFSSLRPLRTDPILTLMQAFRDDPRPGKIDLGVGVWRDRDGRTPVFRAVKAAEEALWRTQTTKSYVGLTGDPEFHAAIIELLLGTARSDIAATATVGGTSAVRQLLALAQVANPAARVWIPAQSWPNHEALAREIGLEPQSYAWLDTVSGTLDRDGVLRDLSTLSAGDVVILHACCHNPTGADPDPDLQDAILGVLDRTGAVPLVDAAYLGFRGPPNADSAVIRAAVHRLPEVMIAFSGSKSFGLYRERVGLALVSGANAAATQSHLAALNRANYTFPPDHGARVVTGILRDTELRGLWLDELSGIRGSLGQARGRLRDHLRDALQTARFDGLTQQHGMFALLPLGAERVARLREDHAIYAVGDGRINLAGVTEETVGPIASAIATVLR